MPAAARTAWAVLVLALSVVCAAPGAFAQVADAPAVETQRVESSPGEMAQTADVPSDEAPPAAARSPNDPPDAPAGDQQPVEPPSGVAAQMADWVILSGDNGGRPFVIVDKLAADLFVFDADGRLQGAAPVLVGLVPGDDSAAGVGDRELSAIPPDERTTPAGRFVASFGAASGGRTVLWVDYADAISLHPVVTSNPKERRLKRLRSPAPEDRRITYGCINVPAGFYKDVVLKAFAGGSAVVYILPDTRPLDDVFPAFAALARASAGRYAAAGQAPRRAAGSLAPAGPNAPPRAAGDQPVSVSATVSTAGADETRSR